MFRDLSFLYIFYVRCSSFILGESILCSKTSHGCKYMYCNLSNLNTHGKNQKCSDYEAVHNKGRMKNAFLLLLCIEFRVLKYLPKYLTWLAIHCTMSI